MSTSQILPSEPGQILIPWRIKALGTSLGGTKDRVPKRLFQPSGTACAWHM